jgi:hypothetical protein
VKRRQFEEILDECISAYLSGRRSVADSLSLYPSIARELEPLLRAAADTADTLQELKPPPQVQERIRQRIIQAANDRAAARALTRDIEGFGPPPPRRSMWVIALPAVAATVAAVAVGATLLLRDSSDGTDGGSVDVVVNQRPEFNSNLEEARRRLDALQIKAGRGEEVTSADLETLVGATLKLAEADAGELPAVEQARVEEMIEDQLDLLDQLDEDVGDSDEIEDAVAATVSVAVALGVPIPVDSQDASPTATTRATPVASASPSSSPAPSATPSSN